MARQRQITMATDTRGQVTYAVFPPSVTNIAGGILAASTAQSITLPATPDANVPWQVFLSYGNATTGFSDVYVSYSPVNTTPITPVLPTGTFGSMNCVREPAAWVCNGGDTLTFISANADDEINLIWYLGVQGNY